MAIRFEGKKNLRTITCTSTLQLSCLLLLEEDNGVSSYFEPQMELIAHHEGIEYLIPIHIWADHLDAKPSFISLIDPKTDQLFNEHPEILADVQEHCRSINVKYVPMRASDLPVSAVRPYLRQLREKKQLALRP